MGDIKEGISEINVMDNCFLNNDMVDIYKKTDWASSFATEIQKEKIITLKLTNILLKNKVDKNFDILVIDVEGFELNVLLSLDFKLFKPKLIIIELEEEHDSFKYREDCKKLKI